MTTEAEGPQLLAKLRGVLVEESRKLDLKGFDIRLFGGKPHVSRSTSYGDQEIASIPQRRQRTKREPSSRLEHSSMTTSSSLPRISEMRLLIHLQHSLISLSTLGVIKSCSYHSLLHDLDVQLGHVHLLIKLRRELGLLEELCIHRSRHFCG